MVMQNSDRGIERWVCGFLGATLLLGACFPARAEQQPLPKSPDAPAPPSPTDSAAPVSAQRAPARQGTTPDAEAPSLGGPSGPFESGSPDGAPSTPSGQAAPATGGEPERPLLEEEAPSLGGPSGAEQPVPEETGSFAPWWTRVPNVQPFPPPGNTIIPPRGPGYYTLWELLRGDYQQAPPRYPYPRFGIMMFSYFNADWRYLDTAESGERDYWDFLKRIRLGDDFMFTTGGNWR